MEINIKNSNYSGATISESMKLLLKSRNIRDLNGLPINKPQKMPNIPPSNQQKPHQQITHSTQPHPIILLNLLLLL
jgi:hypothetical protein